MVTVLKRLLGLALALIFLVGGTVQSMTPNMAAAQTSISAGMAGDCDGPKPPCTGHMPNCIDHACCIAASALPPPVSTVTPSEWTSLDYDLAAESLTGISLKPELSPPILVA